MSEKSDKPIGFIQLIAVIAVVGFTLVLSASLEPDLKPQSQSGGAGPAAAVKKAPTVSIFSGKEESYTPSLRLSSVVIVGADSTIAAQVTGPIKTVSDQFRNGGQIKKGDILFTIDPVDYQLAMDRAQAELQSAETNLAFEKAKADIAVSDWKKTFPGKEITPLAARENQVKSAAARLETAKASAKTATLNLQRTTIKAPFDGRIISTNLAVGQIVIANQSVGRLYAFNRLELQASASEEEIKRFAPLIGRTVTFAGGTGTVVRLGANLDQRTRMGQVYIKPTLPEQLVIGSYIPVYIKGSPLDRVIRIPSTFVSMGEVWTVIDGKLSPTQLTIVGYDGDTVLALPFDGYKTIVTALPSRAEAGMAVTTQASNQ